MITFGEVFRKLPVGENATPSLLVFAVVQEDISRADVAVDDADVEGVLMGFVRRY